MCHVMHQSTGVPSLECQSLNAVRHITFIVQMKTNSQVSDAVVTLNEDQGHRTEKIQSGPLVELSLQQTGWALL